jgi:hypothetical protein
MQFKYQRIREMPAKPGTQYSTNYYKQTAAEYTRLDQHVRATAELIITTAEQQNILEDLDQPLTGFPRSQRRGNYSALDIVKDMIDQLNHERDIPSGMLGRWNRLFEQTPELQIEFVEDIRPNPVYNQLFA